MSDEQLSKYLSAFNLWTKKQRKILLKLQPWLKQQGFYTADAHHAIENSLAALADKRITVAVAGEFSRGKTELINALFFSDFGRRLLPTDVGRTTMCPTELFQDDEEDPYLRLLPIESRLSEQSLNELRADRDEWVSIPLDLATPEKLAEILGEIAATQEVTPEEANRLGLDGSNRSDDGEHAIIPKWRLAQINFRHPLLAQGLRILDTPGLNAVGNEPELTYEMLPTAQAVLFVLGIDTGVTRSDLDIWEQFIQGLNERRNQNVMIVLNKTDTQWDELKNASQIAKSIEYQRRSVANTLKISQDQVFAMSAQKALVSRIQSDETLEQISGIDKLEKYLGHTIVQNRRQLIIDEHTDNVRNVIETLENIIQSRMNHNIQQAKSLQDLSGQSKTAIAQMLKQVGQEKKRYQASVVAYKKSHASFKRHGKILLKALNLDELDQVFDQARTEMSGAWTTPGLKRAMKILFDDINERMETVSHQAQSMRRLVRTIYRRFETSHDFPEIRPMMFSIVQHQVELGLLHQEAEIFRNSARTALTEQHFVVKRYFKTILNRVRLVFEQAREEAKQWLGDALAPLTMQIKERRRSLDRQIRDLQHAGKSRKTIHVRIKALKQKNQKLQVQLNSLHKVQHALHFKAPEQQGADTSPVSTETSPDSTDADAA